VGTGTEEVKHEDNGLCEKCHLIFDRFPGFNLELRNWFEAFQEAHPEAHISCAGRGRAEQDLRKKEGRSRASYGKSAHNYNAAIDVFEHGGNLADIYEDSWFRKVLMPAVPNWIAWYGTPNAPYYELPHLEMRSWKEMLANGTIHLVE